MVSTRRSGSLNENNTKRSSPSSEDKPPRPKQQKVDNGSASDKSTPAENSKQLCTTPVVIPPERGSVDPPTAGGGGGEAPSSGKVDSTQAVAQGFCRSTHRFNDLVLKDQTVSANLCVIKQAKYADTFVAMLESRGMKGSVQVNGKIIKRGNICVVNSGDETPHQLVVQRFRLLNEELVRQKDEVDAKVEEEPSEGVGSRESQGDGGKGEPEKKLEEERAKAASKRATLQKELDKERAKAASERVAYPDLCDVTVQQFKGSAEFQMAVDVAVASSLARQESGRAGPSRTTAGRRTEAEVIESFQQSDFYKHEMAEFWDSGWKMFKRRAEELFPDLDLSSVTIGENDVAQTPLDEGIEEEDLISSEEE
ncbi:unnamed protein product [Camellia sinensis]